MKPTSATAVANHFIALSLRDNNPIDAMKLHYLVYLAFGWYLAVTGRRLFEDALVVGEFGPQIPSLYERIRRFGTEPLRHTIDASHESAPVLVDMEHLQLVERIWELHKSDSPLKLAAIGHAPTSPWAQLTQGGKKIRRGTRLPLESVRDYFTGHLRHGP